MHVEHRLDGESIKNYKFAFFFCILVSMCGLVQPVGMVLDLQGNWHIFLPEEKSETDTFPFFGPHLTKKKFGS